MMMVVGVLMIIEVGVWGLVACGVHVQGGRRGGGGRGQ